MTIYYDEAPVRVHEAVWLFASVNRRWHCEHPSISVTYLGPHPDGSGKIGSKMYCLFLHQLKADGSIQEIWAECAPYLTHQLGKDQFMSLPLSQLEEQTLSQLAELYNSMVPKARHIKKFSDRATALRRITDEFAAEKPMNYKGMRSKHEKLGQAHPQKYKTNVQLDSNRELSVNLTVTKSKMLKGGALMSKNEKPQPENVHRTAGDTSPRQRSNYLNKYIYRAEGCKKENPRRQNSTAYNDFELIRDGMLFQDYRNAGGQLHHFNYCLKRGYVTLHDTPIKE
jgi:hypothetical protein